MIHVRVEREDDREIVYAVEAAAFGRPYEAALVEALRIAGAARLSLVAERAGFVVGHVLFSPVWIEGEAGRTEALGMGPVAVLPADQRSGIGSHLVRTGLEECRSRGHGVVVVLGNPAYYGRFGFEAALPRGLRHPDEALQRAFQVIELVPGALEGVAGVVRYRREFEGG